MDFDIDYLCLYTLEFVCVFSNKMCFVDECVL
jgi:hypothetical protein